jgi:orotidine-5'-phosphate decarboxylase
MKECVQMSFDRLIEKIIKTQNPTVVGLDPKLDYVPKFIRDKNNALFGTTLQSAAASILDFNKGLIDVICNDVPAIKPQSAYYEMYGYHGVKALYDTIEYAKKKDMFVIVDGKRNDIGATMEAYSTAYLGKTDIGNGVMEEAFGADALTVNGYLGTDGISPLTEICKRDDKGIFILVKTSNQSSGELQDRLFEDGRTVYNVMGDLCEIWGADTMGRYGYSAVGAVVGATYPEQLAEMRAKLPHTFFLVPGYGAQGGGAEGVAKAFDKNGLGAIVNSSRAVMCAYQKEGCPEEDYAAAALREVLRMKEDITSHISAIKA